MTGVGHRDTAGCEQKDAFTDPFLMTINSEGATSDEINSPLCLVGFHHRQVEDDGTRRGTAGC